MAEQFFLEGQPPDFSLLQRLLCLEAEPCRPLLSPASPGGGATGDARRSGVPEPLPEPRSPPVPPGEGLTFLQETARLLAHPEPPPEHLAAFPEQTGLPPVPPGGPDALSLISLQCRYLAGGPGNGPGSDTGNGSDTENGPRNGGGTGSGPGNAGDTGNGPSSDGGSSPRNGGDTGNGPGSGDGNGSDTGKGSSTGNGPGNASGSGSCPGAGGGRRRKQAAPQRGAEPRDPAFRGVTVRVSLGPPAGGSEGRPLLITARARRSRTQGSSPGRGSSSEDDAPHPQGTKRCASCKTRRTPLWRAAENGTPLCNACGIRYKKYRVRCRRCWTIPGKSGTPPASVSPLWGAVSPRGGVEVMGTPPTAVGTPPAVAAVAFWGGFRESRGCD